MCKAAGSTTSVELMSELRKGRRRAESSVGASQRFLRRSGHDAHVELPLWQVRRLCGTAFEPADNFRRGDLREPQFALNVSGFELLCIGDAAELEGSSLLHVQRDFSCAVTNGHTDPQSFPIIRANVAARWTLFNSPPI